MNIQRVEELKAAGRMHPSGLAAFDRRSKDRSGIYSYEQRHDAKLEPAHERRFRAPTARPGTSSRPNRPGTERWPSVGGEREEGGDQARRLATLIEDSAHGRAIGPLRRPTSPA